MYDVYGGLGNQLLGSYSNLNFNNYSTQIQQCCCSTADMMNRWQAQQTMNSIQSLELQRQQYKNANEIINSINSSLIPSSFEVELAKEELRDGTNCNKSISIKDYMNKEFLYESELKEIEDKFHFKFEYLNHNKNNEIIKSCKKLINKIKEYDKDLKIIEYLYVDNYIYSINIKTDNQITSRKIYFCDDINSIEVLKHVKDDEKIKNICNTIIKQDIPEYQQFYEKYKNRIVKDNEYEDLSYYEKILKENS